MRRVFSVLLAILIFSTAAVAENHETATDKEIVFSGMEWKCSIDEAKAIIQNTYTNANSIVEKTSEDGADIVTIAFENKASSIGKVAGHQLQKIELQFLNSENFGLFSATYDFGITDYSTYDDLYKKLTSLYGSPSDEKDNTGTDFTGKQRLIRVVWKGLNHTEAYLNYHAYYSGYLSGCEFVRLAYRTGEADTIIDTLKEQEAIKKQEQEERKREELQSDFSGL